MTQEKHNLCMVLLTAIIAFGTLAAAFFTYQSYQVELIKVISQSAK
ncbi:hypothetical protein [Bacillus sp. FJAT-47783]|nr:hypothetical protein [Bacillus sp. FJAT-47783]